MNIESENFPEEILPIEDESLIDQKPLNGVFHDGMNVFLRLKNGKSHVGMIHDMRDASVNTSTFLVGLDGIKIKSEDVISIREV